MSDEQRFQDTIGLIVHSYNNYLSGLMGFTELAQMECQQDVVNERLDMSLDSGKEAILFGKQLLSSIGRLQTHFKVIELVPLCQQIAQQYGCNFNQNEYVESFCIKTDSDWFSYCLKSIVEFCRDFFKNSDMTIRLAVCQNDIHIRLISPSMNLTTEQVTNLFLPFYSSRVLLGKKELGLAVVSGFVGQMKGSIKWLDEGGFLIQVQKHSL